MRTGRPLLDVVWTGVPPPSTLLAPPCFANPTKRCDWRAQPAIIRGGTTTLGELTPPRTGSSCVGGCWFLPSSHPTKGSSFPVRSYDPLPLQGVWWVLLLGFQFDCPCLLLSRWSCSFPFPPSPPPPPPPMPPFCCGRGLGTWISLSSPRTILTLNSAGCRCSAFELSKFDAVDD